MQFAITITETDDLLRASTMLASLHAILSGGQTAPTPSLSAALQVASPATQEEQPPKAKRARTAKPDPVETYNAMAAAAGAAPVDVEEDKTLNLISDERAAEPAVALDDPFASILEEPKQAAPAAELTVEQKREEIVKTLRKNAANMAKLGLTRDMGWISSWTAETVDTIHAKILELGL